MLTYRIYPPSDKLSMQFFRVLEQLLREIVVAESYMGTIYMTETDIYDSFIELI